MEYKKGVVGIVRVKRQVSTPHSVCSEPYKALSVRGHPLSESRSTIDGYQEYATPVE